MATRNCGQIVDPLEKGTQYLIMLCSNVNCSDLQGTFGTTMLGKCMGTLTFEHPKLETPVYSFPA